MKKLEWPVRAIIFLGLLQVVSCTKTSDTVTNDSVSLESSSNATAADVFANCKIRRIYQTIGYEPNTTTLFSYNKTGNPYSVIYTPGGTGVRDHYFKYDSQNRLTELVQAWTQMEVEHHYYRYNAANQIVYDSARHFDSAGSFRYETISTIEYDVKGRVVKETIVNTRNKGGTLEATRRPTYTYDARGNLAVAGWKSSTYDNKINPLRQSPVFQFVHRNYSQNNAAPQAKYNSRGLPLSMNPSNDMFFNDITTLKIIYDCQ